MSKTSKRAIITIIIATFLISMIPIMPVSAAEHDSAVDLYSSTEVWEATYTTIQAAIDAATDGDIIEVSDVSSPYTEDITFDVDNLELRPETGDTVILKGATAGTAPLATSNLYIDDVDGVSVHGFTIQPATTSVGNRYVTMIHVHGADAEIYDNIFTLAGTHVDDELVGIVSTQTVDVSGLNIHDNTFTATQTSTEWLEGIYINLNAGTGTVTIEDNTISGDLVRAICTEHDKTTITGNTITGDLVWDAGYATGEGYAGIQVGGTVASVDTVDINNNDVSGFQSGVRASATTMTAISVTDNFLDDNYYSVKVVNDADEVTVNYNDLLGTLGIDNDDTTATVNAEYNWWGVTTDSTVLALTEGLVDYTPWLTAIVGTSGEGFSIDFVTAGYAVYGDTLTVEGSGVTSGSTVNLYWDFVTASGLLNSTTGLPSGEFESTVKVPSAYYGAHYLWAKDLSTGISTRSGPITVVPKITLSPSSGLKTDDITVKGYGFDVDSVITFDFGGVSTDTGDDETDDLGYFEYIFEVADVSDGPYTVTATDADANDASATFTVGAAITIDKTVGPAGTQVKVDGRGFTPGTIIRSENNITLDGTIPVSTKDGNNVTASSTGAFTLYIVIPSVETGDYEITINDGIGKVADASFEVDGETSITVTPSYGTPGTVLTVKGYNFTRIHGTEVELKLEDQVAEATTDASGSFTASIIIPPLDFGVTYAVTANDTRLCNAEDDVLVALMVLQLSAYSAPVGSEVMLMGSGLTVNGYWNATFGDMKLIEDSQTSTGTTYFSKDFWVPSVPSGTYTIGVYDVAREITVNIDFTVTEQAALSVSRAAIPNGYNLTLEGVNFMEEVDQETEWWIYNSTDAWNIDDNVTQGPVVFPSDLPVTDKYGDITAWYVIPAFLELGSYTINCTTVSNAPTGETWVVNQTAEVDIELVPEEVLIDVGNPSYAKGQTITFVIKATLKKNNFKLGIKDPEGGEVFNSTWLTADWKTLGSWYYIPSNLQIDDYTDWLYTLPADAMPGTWTYEFWTAEKVYATGSFEVTLLTEIEQLQQNIGEIVSGIAGMGASNAELAALVTDLQGASAEAVAAAAAAAAAAGDAQTAAESAMAAISDVDDTASDALDAANDARTSADLAKDAADSGLAAALNAQTTAQQAADAADKAADAAEGAKSATSGLTTLVYGAIGASLIAALAAIVSLMQISRRIAG